MIQTILIGVVVLVAFLLQRKYYVAHWKEDLDVKVKFMEAELPEYEQGTLKIVIENRKKMPLSALVVKFQTDRHLEFEKNKGSVTTDQFYHNDVFQVGGGERVTRTLHFYGKKRGYYRINNIDLSGFDLLMSCEMHSSFQPSESIFVLPKPYESRDFQMMMQQLNGDMITKRNLYEDPFEIRGIREYQPFDSMRSINWKATAKTGKFMVNQRNYTTPKSVRIFLNLEDRHLLRKLDELEDCIRIAAGLSKYLLEQGIKVSFYCNSHDILTGDPILRAPGKGPNQISSILRNLCRIDLEKEAQDFATLFQRRILTDQENTYTCFISITHDDDFLALLQKFSAQGRVFSWFYPKSKRFIEDDIPVPLRSSLRQLRMI
ncbi:MAG: DUF58 domain-containing protein [Lachnospiraceae bacterium]|nr:DUF58 domain-containing protein [Lachnospiraceae bacterium]